MSVAWRLEVSDKRTESHWGGEGISKNTVFLPKWEKGHSEEPHGTAVMKGGKYNYFWDGERGRERLADFTIFGLDSASFPSDRSLILGWGPAIMGLNTLYPLIIPPLSTWSKFQVGPVIGLLFQFLNIVNLDLGWRPFSWGFVFQLSTSLNVVLPFGFGLTASSLFSFSFGFFH